MKKFEAKTTMLLALPALALVAFASILSLRGQKRDFGPPYRVVRHEVVLERDMTGKETNIARICKIPKGRAVAYRYEVKPRQVGFFDNLMLGGTDTIVHVNGSSCREEGTGLGIAPHFSGSSHITGNNAQDYSVDIYDFADIDDHPVEFSFPLTWEENEKTHTLTLRKRVVAQELK